MPPPWRINLGGEGEVAGVLNQQGPWALGPSYRASATGQTLAAMVGAGHQFLISENIGLLIPDGSFDEVITNNIPPVDSVSFLGPTVQTAEIRRILKSGGRWFHDGAILYTKP
jgi:hypothetical protein